MHPGLGPKVIVLSCPMWFGMGNRSCPMWFGMGRAVVFERCQAHVLLGHTSVCFHTVCPALNVVCELLLRVGKSYETVVCAASSCDCRRGLCHAGPITIACSIVSNSGSTGPGRASRMAPYSDVYHTPLRPEPSAANCISVQRCTYLSLIHI